MRKSMTALATAAGFLLLVGSSAHANTWIETGDAGETIVTAQAATGTGNLATITGNLTVASSGDKDLYRITITDGAAFSATTIGGTGRVGDPMLFLFAGDGRFLVGNDDWFGLQSYIGGNPAWAAGEYLLGVSGCCHWLATDSNGIFTNWTGGHSYTGAYQVNLTGASFSSVNPVPEPGAWATMAIMGGMTGLGVVRQRRRRKSA